MSEREISVDYLARVEGEGAMYLSLDGDTVTDLQFSIFEPPRFFEAFLQGRRLEEAPDITSRICGICPVAYQMSAINAMEDALNVHVTNDIRDLRLLLYCGEWIESHALHVYMLHTPDFLGYESSIHMAADHPTEVKQGLRIKKIGNDLMTLLGGREIHPINAKVGGFYKMPAKSDLDALVSDLQWGLEAAIDSARWVGTFDFPDFERDYEFVSVDHPTEYPILGSRLVSTAGLDIGAAEWNDVFEESHVAHSNALHAKIRGRGAYHVGPLARFSLHRKKLPDHLQKLSAEVGLAAECRNPFKSIVVRCLEMAFAFETALNIIDRIDVTDAPAVSFQTAAGVGHGLSEAPRGLLYHRYEIDSEGLIVNAQITPPTAQNQLSIEDDLRDFVVGRTHLPDEDLKWQLEQAIRSYDPCISCATHFLDLTVHRS